MLFGCFIQNKGWEYLSEYVLGFHKKLCTLNKCVHYIGFDWGSGTGAGILYLNLGVSSKVFTIIYY